MTTETSAAPGGLTGEQIDWQDLCARLRAKTPIYDGAELIDYLYPSELQLEAASFIESAGISRIAAANNNWDSDRLIRKVAARYGCSHPGVEDWYEIPASELMPFVRAVLASAPKAAEQAPVADAARADAAEREHCERIVLRAERDRERARNDHLMQVLTRIYGLLTPEDVRLPDGRVMRFDNPEIERKILRGLCAAIRAIPAAITSTAPAQQAVTLMDAATALESKIPAGWQFYSADFSLSPGRVMLVRDAAGKNWWRNLPEELGEGVPLFVSGSGTTLARAIDTAANRIAALQSHSKGEAS